MKSQGDFVCRDVVYVMAKVVNDWCCINPSPECIACKCLNTASFKMSEWNL